MEKIEEPKLKLDLFTLVDETQRQVTTNKQKYSRIAMEIVQNFYNIFLQRNLTIIGINHRIKSPDSLKEKIIRKKLYKNCNSPEEIFEKLPDLIGVMIECEFISDEKNLYTVIKEYFTQLTDNGFCYNEKVPNIFVNLDITQPVKQKNGNDLYKLDCYYVSEEVKINFEVQIKSLVNSFWSEVEHNIVYKNNYYVPTDDYIQEMMSAVRMNLMGLDKILQLVNDHINVVTGDNVVKNLDFNESHATQLVSDLINKKMIESIGFTVEVKKIRELLSWYIMNRVNSMPDSERDLAFYKYRGLFSELHKHDMNFDKAIQLEGEFHAEDIFSETLGNGLLRLMNKDFEWNTFFVMLFEIEGESSKLECFKGFIKIIKDLYCDSSLFDNLFDKLPSDKAELVLDETQLFIAEALCDIGKNGIMSHDIYKKGLEDIKGFLQYTLNCIEDFEGWVSKRRAIQSVITRSLQKK